MGAYTPPLCVRAPLRRRQCLRCALKSPHFAARARGRLVPAAEAPQMCPRRRCLWRQLLLGDRVLTPALAGQAPRPSRRRQRLRLPWHRAAGHRCMHPCTDASKPAHVTNPPHSHRLALTPPLHAPSQPLLPVARWLPRRPPRPSLDPCSPCPRSHCSSQPPSLRLPLCSNNNNNNSNSSSSSVVPPASPFACRQWRSGLHQQSKPLTRRRPCLGWSSQPPLRR